MKRKSGWEAVLSNEIEAAMMRPFSWGSHDCCMFACRVVKALTGTDPGRGLRGYRSAASASRMLRAKGKGTLLKTLISVMARHGCKQIHPNFARRGDVVFAIVPAETGTGPAAGICIGRQAAFAADGLALIAMSEVKRAWRCG